MILSTPGVFVILRLSSFGAVALFACPAADAAVLAGGWEVYEAEEFCYAWLATPEPGGTEFGLAVDAGERATIILSNKAWPLRPNRSYRMTAGLPGSMKSIKARSLNIGGGRLALAADVNDASFVERFAASADLKFALQKIDTGPTQGKFKLTGAQAVVASLRTCHEKLKVRVRDRAREREVHVRTDPNAGQTLPGTN